MRPLFVLRPEPGASETAARARAMGLDAIAAPLFGIEPVGWSPPSANEFDGLLLTSANAVHHAGSSLAAFQALPVLAVGEATADEALRAGFTVEQTGTGGIDELLDSVAGSRRLLHLCGEDRRQQVDSSHSIVAVPVYRSRPLPAPGDLSGIAGAVAAIHSPRAGKRLAELVDPESRASVRIAAISLAAADAVGAGWESVDAAEAIGDEPLLALAARLCQKAARDDDRSEPDRA